MRTPLMRRLRPDRDIFRVGPIPGAHEDDPQWGVYRVSFSANGKGFRMSEHRSRDEARAAKKKHEDDYDQARGRL